MRGSLKKVRGSSGSIIINIDPSATAPEILSAAVTKHSLCNCNFASDIEYVLLYPDAQPVINIPGQEQPFSLSNYQKFMGKAFRELVLFICSKDTFESGFFCYVLS